MRFVSSLQHVFGFSVPCDNLQATMDDAPKSWLTEYLERMGVMVCDKERCPAGQAVVSMYNLNSDNGQQVTYVTNHVRNFNERCTDAEAVFFVDRREIHIFKKVIEKDADESEAAKGDLDRSPRFSA